MIVSARITGALMASVSAILCGCGSGGADAPTLSPTPTPASTASPTSSPTATPTPVATPQGPIVASPSSLVFVAVGASNATSVSMTETGYSGAFHESDTCSGIATVAAGGASTLDVTPLAPGSCSISISDAFAQKSSLNVSVTTTSGTISARPVGGNE